jgi:uncharacterized BrkB/YihY/UPF0761 family membrane protein
VESVLTLSAEEAWPTIRRSLVTIYNDIYEERLFVFAAGLSYYFVLSLFPLLVSMAAPLSYVPIPHLFDGLLTLMAKLVPGDGMSMVRNIVSDVMSHKHRHFLTYGLLFTIWTASSGFAATIDGLNIVYRVRETRPVWKTRPIALGLTLLAGSLLLLAVGFMVEGTYLGIWFTARFDLDPGILAVWRYLQMGRSHDVRNTRGRTTLPFRSRHEAAFPGQSYRSDRSGHHLDWFVVSTGELFSTLRQLR